ncbi:MAG: hypothetical protein QM752_00650 [Gammaproteobacteria bacterium]
MKRFIHWLSVTILLGIFQPYAFAQQDSSINPLSNLTQIPTQQFVTADDNSASAAPNTTPPAAPDVTPANNPPQQPIDNSPPADQPPPGPINMPPVQDTAPPAEMVLDNALAQTIAPSPPQTLPTPPRAPQLQPVATVPGVVPNTTPSASTLETPASAEQVVNPTATPTNVALSGGINSSTFNRCQKLIRTMCYNAVDANRYRLCLSTPVITATCQQFLSFVALTDFGPKDDIDVIQRYGPAKLDLIRVRRWGINFPGDYYAIGSNGNLVNIASGPEARAINIKQDVAYPKLAEQYPQAQLWSLIEGLPQQEVLPDGQGVRLTFRFKVLNGCSTCQLIGHANIGYDFTLEGDLKQVELLSLQSI